ncbi:hypothetical protein BDZ91DRAFT_792566 [Kalaharituber pfeilii]|nr:hypothetical protein BDZ91DRAFT_803929 [Kalaharituber pfeilii]KAF8454268.1 hypothetical protein BDZ91DRAFT_801865 [Kalaharituber pfeilii]KAF8469785.1 hypothetical protein BDZ91DRAFT_792566 [Kalaharituber pfeilii]
MAAEMAAKIRAGMATKMHAEKAAEMAAEMATEMRAEMAAKMAIEMHSEMAAKMATEMATTLGMIRGVRWLRKKAILEEEGKKTSSVVAYLETETKADKVKLGGRWLRTSVYETDRGRK